MGNGRQAVFQATVDGAAVADNHNVTGAKGLVEHDAGMMDPFHAFQGRRHRRMLAGANPHHHLEGLPELAQGVLNDGLEVEGAPGDVFADDVASHVKRQFDDLHPGPGHQVILNGNQAGERFDGRWHRGGRADRRRSGHSGRSDGPNGGPCEGQVVRGFRWSGSSNEDVFIRVVIARMVAIEEAAVINRAAQPQDAVRASAFGPC